MPTDAKCGLLVGVLAVVAVAVLFFQKEDAPPTAALPAPIAQKASVPKSVPAPLPRPESPGTPGVTVSRPSMSEE